MPALIRCFSSAGMAVALTTLHRVCARLSIAAVCCAGLSFVLLAAPLASAQPSPCHLPGIEAWVECGELDVPLDHGQPSGEQITIGYARLPAVVPSEGATPLFVLAGGPGQSAVGLAGQINASLSKVRRERDIVLVDQRGIGRSSPLSCELEMDQPYAPEFEFFDPDVLAACLAQLPAGLGAFNTFNAVQDFDAVRQHLGYSQVQLYGGSYGSRAAIAYVALLPQSVERVVLDGVAPPAVPIGLFGQSAAAAYERVLARCAQDTDCAQRFPDTRSQWREIMQRLERGPVELTLPNPTTGADEPVRLFKAGVVGLMRMLLYAPETAAMLPLAIDRLYNEDYRPLLSLLAAIGRSEIINPVVNLNIVCNEDYPRWSPESAVADADNSFGGDASHRLWSAACPSWPSYQLSDEQRYDFVSDIPALLLSGAGDPVTPPAQAETAVQSFSNSRHVVVAAGAHIVGMSECGDKVLASFLSGTAPSDLETNCFADQQAPAFVLDSMGSLSTGRASAGVAP